MLYSPSILGGQRKMWESLTEPQAMIISACITVAAAVVGVLLGSWLFGGRVRDLQTALDASKQMVGDHRQHVEQSINEIQAKLAELETLFASTSETLGQVRGSIGDLSASDCEPRADIEHNNYRDSIRAGWERIRDTLETMAADPRIDGRTRAKYARIDRRNYHWLIESLDADGRLGGASDRFRESVDLWHRFRSGRTQPEREHAEQMANLQDSLTRLFPAN